MPLPALGLAGCYRSDLERSYTHTLFLLKKSECTCTGKSPVLEAGLLGSSALGRLPFISRALASICGDALSEVGAVQHACARTLKKALSAGGACRLHRHGRLPYISRAVAWICGDALLGCMSLTLCVAVCA